MAKLVSCVLAMGRSIDRDTTLTSLFQIVETIHLVPPDELDGSKIIPVPISTVLYTRWQKDGVSDSRTRIHIELPSGGISRSTEANVVFHDQELFYVNIFEAAYLPLQTEGVYHSVVSQFHNGDWVEVSRYPFEVRFTDPHGK